MLPRSQQRLRREEGSAVSFLRYVRVSQPHMQRQMPHVLGMALQKVLQGLANSNTAFNPQLGRLQLNAAQHAAAVGRGTAGANRAQPAGKRLHKGALFGSGNSTVALAACVKRPKDDELQTAPACLPQGIGCAAGKRQFVFAHRSCISSMPRQRSSTSFGSSRKVRLGGPTMLTG